jgi:hypothetical protein
MAWSRLSSWHGPAISAKGRWFANATDPAVTMGAVEDAGSGEAISGMAPV